MGGLLFGLLIALSAAAFLILFVGGALLVWATWELGGPWQGTFAAVMFAAVWVIPIVNSFDRRGKETVDPAEGTGPGS
ncbi:hypothetical protein ACFPM3_19420 [Streptomyces coeruleoprunus]|uniref:Integral membrane protein n=1 Tax=Streptomyces coeruleoprunus TaxID=285563 RepID=A0ABV9XFW7_9ACTN